MNNEPALSDSIRGKRLHRDLAAQVVSQFDSRHFDDAVLTAFKVVEERLRKVVGQPGYSARKLIETAFNPTTGTLNDSSSLGGQIEGRYFLFRGAFQSYRNSPAHGFPNWNADEAFDLVVLANRLLIILEDAHQRHAAKQYMDASVQPMQYRHGGHEEAAPFMLDSDNDGESEVIIARYDTRKPLTIYDLRHGMMQPADVEALNDDLTYEIIEGLTVADVDNDGLNELVCLIGWATSTGLLIYKFDDGRYEVMRHRPLDGVVDFPVFIEARIVDYETDGQLEIVSEPWWSVPDELRPEGTDPNAWGRVRYVWRWVRAEDLFELVHRELLYIGGR